MFYFFFFTVLPFILSGCQSTVDMTLKKEPSVKMQVLKAEEMAGEKISSVLALKPTLTKRTNLLPEDIREKSFFINMIEDFLLSNGYTVITNDFLINVRNSLSPRLDPDKLRNSEFAMLIDSRFVDALIKINSLKISLDDFSFIIEDDRSEIVQSKEALEKKIKVFNHRGYEAGDEYCIHQVPYYQFEWSVELIHIKSGRILAKGYQKANSLNHLPKDYKAKFELGDNPSCIKVEENFKVKSYTSTAMLKKNLVKYMNEALIKLFREFPAGKNKNKTLQAIESYDDIGRIGALSKPAKIRKKEQDRKAVKRNGPGNKQPEPVSATPEEPVKESEDEQKSTSEEEKSDDNDSEDSPESGSDPEKDKELKNPQTEEERLIQALRKW